MKFRIFMLAFTAGFALFLTFAGITVFRYAKNEKEVLPEEPPEERPYLDVEYANFLLIFTDEEKAKALVLVRLDGKSNRIPVFGFSPETVLVLKGNVLSAGELFSAAEPEVMLGAVEKALEIAINGYFILDREACEAVLKKTGGFDYILPSEIISKGGGHSVSLAAGNQNIGGKKFCDILFYEGFTEDERANTASRMISSYLGKRLRRFSSDREKISSLLYSTAITDVDAYDSAELAGLIDFLANSDSVTAGYVKCETEPDENNGLLLLTDSTVERLSLWFNK